LPKRTFRLIETLLGIVRGRDAIYLDSFEYELHSVVKLAGGINGKLASNPIEKFVKYSLSFTSVLAFKVVELDSWDYQSESSFDKVVDSDWRKTLGGKITPEHKHYLIQTYDDVIEVVATKFSLKISDD